jgi:hypothetical protein
MTLEKLIVEIIERTGEWSIPEYTKILDCQMTGIASHKFRVLFYNHGIGETEIEITLKDISLSNTHPHPTKD